MLADPHRSPTPSTSVRGASFARLLPALLVIAGLLSSMAHGQPAPAWVVGVIASVSAGGPLGAEQARAAEFAAAALARQGVFGAPFLVDVRDDGGDPRRAEAVARELIDQGALLLVCCTTPAASERVSAVAEASAVPLLSLDGAFADETTWTLSLRPDTRTQLTAIGVHAAERGKASLALMTLDNAFGDHAAEAFERALSDAGRTPAGTVQYSPSANVLTPEALWAATRMPGAIVVWGLAPDTGAALDGLRRRGWLGPVYVRPEALALGAWARLDALAAVPGAPPTAGDAWWHVRTAAAPVSVASLLPEAHPNRPAALAAIERLRAAGVRAEPITLANVARVDDAVVLAQRAFEGVAALGLPPGMPPATLRQAVLDALLSAPAQPLAAGTYHASGFGARYARWQGLVVLTVH